MKKLFFTLCALCLCGTMWGAEYDSATGLYYDYVTSPYDSKEYLSIVAPESGSYTIENLTKNDDGSYSIPEYVGDNLAITRVDGSAFKDALTDTDNLIHLVIPTYIMAIGQEAFQNCTQINEVTYEYSNEDLRDENGTNNEGTESFLGCSNLKTVNLNRNVGIGSSTRFCAPFCWQTSIESINIGEHVTTIANYMFRNSTGTIMTVTSYAINPPSWTYDPFSSVNAECVLYVYASAKEFYEDSSWANIFNNIQTMEDPEEEQPEGTLMDVTTGLFFEINEETGVVSIIADQKSGAYTDENLVYVEEGNYYTFPESVIDKTGVGGSVTRIGESAFNGSAVSGHIYIPAFITAMGEGSFTGSTHITEVTYEYSDTPLYDEKSDNNERQTQAFYGCSGIVTVNLNRDITPGSTTGLCTPFCWQSTILTINIGPRVTTIPQYMFRDTSNNGHPLSAINVYAAVPPTFDSSRRPFDRVDTYTLSVPEGSENAYEESVWSDYINSSDSSSDTGNCTFTTLSNAYAVTISELAGLDESYYATYYNENAVDIYPQGGTENEVTTYAATGVEVEGTTAYLDLAEVGATVPAGVAVLVDASAAGTYTVIETTAAKSASYSGTNDLYGFLADNEYYAVAPDTDNDYYFYKLTLDAENDSNSLGFYWGNSDGSAFTGEANKAYLVLTQGALQGLSAVKLKKGEGEDTTGITSVEVENETNTVKGIYTVQGIRVSNMNQPGLYIVDGKKVLKR